jgi:endonuclease/exonuclease/phosphatase family metal-dependent hydrolase
MPIIRMATWNVRGGTSNSEEVARHLIEHERVDVAALQEVDSIQDLYYEFVRERGYFRDCVYVSSTYQPGGPKGTNAVAIFSTREINEYGYRDIGHDTGGDRDPWERHIVYALVGSPFFLPVFAAHYSTGGDDAQDRNMRESLDFMGSFRHDRQVFLGDLNMGGGSLAPIQAIFTDQWRGDGGATFNAQGQLTSRIDYHFARGLTASSIKTFGGSTSDHLGVVAEYDIGQPLSGDGWFQHNQKATGRRLDGQYRSGNMNPPGEVYTNNPNSGDYQRWRFIEDPSNRGDFFIKHRATGLFLDSRATQPGDRQDVYLYWPNMGPNQRWRKIRITSDEYNIQNVASGKLLDANSKGEVYTLSDNGGPYQVWR